MYYITRPAFLDRQMSLFHSTPGLQAINELRYPEITIETGRFTFIAGKSGCGKSTYLKLLNGTMVPLTGDVLYRDRDIRNLDPIEHRKEVVLVPQDAYLTDKTIRDSFGFYHEARGQETPSDDCLESFMQTCCLDMPLDTPTSRLSGGERQRAFLSIFLSFSPKALLLDEPTASLDGKTAEMLLENIRGYCVSNDIETVCVCHDEDLIERFSDDTIRLG